MQCSTAQQPATASKHRQRKKKLPAKVTVPPDAKLLVGREEAAVRLSLSVRSIDYLLADRQLKSRRIGTLVKSQLYEMTTVSGGALAVAVGTLLAASCAAGLIPARRAASVDPARALRAE
jgi:hypothetical protein